MQFDENGQHHAKILVETEINIPEEIVVYCGVDFFESLISELAKNERPVKPYYRKNERW